MEVNTKGTNHKVEVKAAIKIVFNRAIAALINSSLSCIPCTNLIL